MNRPKNFVCKGFLKSDEVLLASVPAPQGTGDFVPRAATATIVSTPHADGPKQRSQGIGTEPSSSMLASARNVHPKMIMVPEEAIPRVKRTGPAKMLISNRMTPKSVIR